MTWIRLALLCTWLAVSLTPAGAVIAAGSGEHRAKLNGTVMTVFTYRPECPDPSLLLVFHGVDRNASAYATMPALFAERLCMVMVAPLFGDAAFPAWRYQRGGIVRRGPVHDKSTWTTHRARSRAMG